MGMEFSLRPRFQFLASLLCPGENAWCFGRRHREDIKQLSDIEATIELRISTVWMWEVFCLFYLFKALTVLLGF